ncbi:hypothetical protein [Marinilabilia rubra]|uniref:Uncharacterized protein n=1 Tax=Marinilabilia rubra TaxID=2162893 RepID=A0A2U2B3Z8_9BACT|nr:hypothetical protein [Marinilabilia rubra]PWD97783.1 hypothetical protein DDZ16_18865 [Marinilabilia rubra]
MKNKNIFKTLLLLIASTAMISTLASCEDENSDDTETDEFETWEPYQLKANTSYEYNFEIRDNEVVTSSGDVMIEIGEPDVEITGTMDGTPFNYTNNNFDDINQNFISAVSQSPIGIVIYQPVWMGAFTNQNLEVGSSWSYSYENNSFLFEITGTDTYGGYEGYVMQTTFTNAEDETVIWNSCVKPEIPLPLMSHVEYPEGEEYFMELTNYQE